MTKQFTLAGFVLVACAGCLPLGPSKDAGSPRRTICLDETWQVAEGKMDTAPAKFSRTRTRDPKTGDAFMRIRNLDLSDRPCDDGYSWPRTPGDTSEQHPYQFNSNFRPWQLATANPDPEAYHNGGGDGKHAIINNEYGWHWVNRDGTPTTLTSGIYKDVLGENATPQQRFHLQATWLAAATEFWRAHRRCAAVIHFVTL